MRVLDDPEHERARSKNITVTAHLIATRRESIHEAVSALNATDLAVIQHEYGIYGGVDGDQVLDVMRALTVPNITVLHTVLADPTPGQAAVLDEVLSLADAVVVMSDEALRLLGRYPHADLSRVSVIPHGVTPPTAARHALSPLPPNGKAPDNIVLSWGLIGPGKGIEWGIRAISLLSDMPNPPHYRVVGQTHPKVLSRDGEAYREQLMSLADSLGVTDRVHFYGDYLPLDELARHVDQAAVVLLPYDSTAQITSGVLAEAVAAGKPVVATAFPHAIELLAVGAGVVTPHGNPIAMAEAMRHILTDKSAAFAMSRAGLEWGKQALWPAVGARYRAVARQIGAAVAA